MEAVKELIRKLQIPSDWELILVGDGSGFGTDKPCTFSCIPIHNGEPIKVEVPLVGGFNRCCTINLAEIMPFWLYLNFDYYQRNRRAKLKSSNGKYRCNVHIVTDSAWGAQAMSGYIDSKKHQDMRKMFSTYTEFGYNLHWHDIRREEYVVHQCADRLASEAREYVASIDAADALEVFSSHDLQAADG